MTFPLPAIRGGPSRARVGWGLQGMWAGLSQWGASQGVTLAPSSPTVERGQKIAEQIVIGTPGTVLDWCSKLKFIDPKKIRVFVLDEADVMIATQGHQDQSIRIQR